MARVLLVLLALTVPLLADARSNFLEAVKKLDDSYYEELPVDQRDRLFEALGEYDHPDAIDSIAQVASLYGAHLSSIQSKLAGLNARMEKYKGRSGLTGQEEGLRNSLIRKIEKAEAEWVRARRSEEILVRIVGSFKEQKTIDTALKRLVRHASPSTRGLLARACVYWHSRLYDEKMSKRFFKTLVTLNRDKETGVRVAVARSLGAFRNDEAYEVLKISLRDGDWRVRAAAVKALHKARTSPAVGLLIDAMQRESGRLVEDINKALEDITGETMVYPEVWKRWWEGNGKKLPKKRPQKQTGQKDPKADTANFYGIPTESTKICFIIDASGSMNKEVEQFEAKGPITGPKKNTRRLTEGKTRWEVAKNELKRAVGNLNSSKEFVIIFFNHAIKKWRPELTKANPGAKKDVRKDLDALSASGTTYTLGALREAFTMAGIISTAGATKKQKTGLDTIFLLSDGGPTDGKGEGKPMDPDIVLEAVREWNRDAGVVIHTIAVDTDEVGTYFLKQLAVQNGGVFVERKQ